MTTPTPVRPAPYRYQYVHVPVRHDPDAKPVNVDTLCALGISAVLLLVLFLIIDSL